MAATRSAFFDRLDRSLRVEEQTQAIADIDEPSYRAEESGGGTFVVRRSSGTTLSDGVLSNPFPVVLGTMFYDW